MGDILGFKPSISSGGLSRRRTLAVALAALAGLLGLGASSGASSTQSVLRGSVVQDRQWVCSGPVDLDSVSVTIDQGSPLSTRGANNDDAVHLVTGCTGRIGQITVVQYRGDGIKVGGGVHDLTIGGGSIRCYNHDPSKHQDGVQVMGGQRVTFRNLDDQCVSANNSALFINRGTGSPEKPTDVVCDGCFLKGGGITVRVYNSIRSGVRNSQIVAGRLHAVQTSPSAVDPVDTGNVVVGSGATGSEPTPAPPSGGKQPKPPVTSATPRIRVAGKASGPVPVQRQGTVGLVSGSVRVDRAALLLVSAVAGLDPTKSTTLLPLLKASSVAGALSGRQHTTVVGHAAAGKPAPIAVRLTLKALRPGTIYNLRITALDGATGASSTVYVPFRLL